MTNMPETADEIKEFLRDYRVARNHPVDPKAAKEELAVRYECSQRTMRRWWTKWHTNPPEVRVQQPVQMPQNPGQGHVPPRVAINGEITEASVESFLLTCMAENPGDPRVANLLISWLDKKKAIQPANDEVLDSNTRYVQEFQEIQAHVYENTNTA